MKTKKFNPMDFKKLLKQDTEKSYKAYLKAQNNYLSVLKKFIKKEIACNGDYEERYELSAVCCLENQCFPHWAYLKDLNNEIKVLDGIISDYEFELLNPEEFKEEDQE
jgi:hypothetical protein